MDKIAFASGMKTLSDFYSGKAITASGMEIWFQKLKWLDHRDFKASIDEVTTCERGFPTPQVILKYADDAKRRRSDRESKLEKNQASNFFKPEKQNPGIARDSVAFIDALRKFKPGSIEKLEFEVSAYKAMIKNYPMLGWEDNYRDAVKRINEKISKSGQTNVSNF